VEPDDRHRRARVVTIGALDAGLAVACARWVRDDPATQSLLAWLAQENWTKSLVFAPFLLVAWYDRRAAADHRGRVLATMASCALALVAVWSVTTLWARPRPIAPESGHALVAAVFGAHFADHPSLRWGCFPSDHAAYLTALSLGLATVYRVVGATAFVIAVFLNGLVRLATGLHYVSDPVAGAVVGLVAHGVAFWLLALPARVATERLVRAIESSLLLQAALVLVVVEMAVMFRDLRVLDRLLFG
jgi:membrane-associated phospholipid phosphatase